MDFCMAKSAAQLLYGPVLVCVIAQTDLNELRSKNYITCLFVDLRNRIKLNQITSTLTKPNQT